MGSVMHEKADLRRMMKTKLSMADSETCKRQGIEAGKLIINRCIWKDAQSILLFMSMRNEIDTRFLLEKALADGKNLFVPRIDEDEMTFCKIDSLDGSWNEGAFGILEPGADHHALFYPDKTDFPLLVITPGAAFDKKGHRLGRGKGYYDRFLSKLKESLENNHQNVTVMGLCLTEQLVDHVPVENFDQKVDVICAGNDYIEICT